MRPVSSPTTARMPFGPSAPLPLRPGWFGRAVTVRAEMAWWYRELAPHGAGLERLETDARQAKRGLWSQPNPTPPWAWRSGKAAPVAVGVVGNKRSRLYHA